MASSTSTLINLIHTWKKYPHLRLNFGSRNLLLVTMKNQQKILPDNSEMTGELFIIGDKINIDSCFLCSVYEISVCFLRMLFDYVYC